MKPRKFEVETAGGWNNDFKHEVANQQPWTPADKNEYGQPISKFKKVKKEKPKRNLYETKKQMDDRLSQANTKDLKSRNIK